MERTDAPSTASSSTTRARHQLCAPRPEREDWAGGLVKPGPGMGRPVARPPAEISEGHRCDRGQVAGEGRGDQASSYSKDMASRKVKSMGRFRVLRTTAQRLSY